MNNTNDLYNRWLAQPDLDDAVKAELVSIAGDSDAVTDRFYRDLEFGTGGLRGVIGAGTNRMNLYTVRKATQGLANYLNASGLPKKVAIAHDSRHNGALFARETARVLAANGITACMYPRLEPTPALSWAVRYLGCGAGVCVTASHNPAKYNGYKVYGADGCQITLEAAEKILAAIEKIDCFDDVRLADFDAAAAAGRIVTIDEKCLDDFVQAVYDQRVGDGAGIDALKLVYTPLNGTGLECVKKLLKKLGVTHVTVVPEQEKPDGDFPTCPYPNPEIREAMQKGLELCDKVRPDLLLGTDPDCDRCGTASAKYGHRIFLISDEPYREIMFGGQPIQYAAKFYDDTLTCYSFSKSLSLPGERIGYVAANPRCEDAEYIVPMCGQISRGTGHNCPASLIQLAVAECLDETSDLGVYETNMELIYAELKKLGFTVVKPSGTFYIFPKALEEDANAFCKKAMKYDLALVPGDSFGCPGYFRMAYCIDTEKVRRSFAALEKFVAEEYGK